MLFGQRDCVIFAAAMNRVVWFIICTVVGLELIACGLLVPVHIRAVDTKVLELQGAQGTSLAGEGLSLVNSEKPGPARMLLQVAEQTGALGRERLAQGVRSLEQAQPKLKVWGGTAVYLQRVFEKSAWASNSEPQPILDLLVVPANRDTVLEALRHSRRPGVLELLQNRALTNTVVFPPALSGSGQALDASILTAALLMQHDQFATGLRGSVQSLTAAANSGGPVEPMEAFYMDLLALGKRLDWTQLAELMKHVPDTNALRETAALFREHEAALPVIYSAILTSPSRQAPSPNTSDTFLRPASETWLSG